MEGILRWGRTVNSSDLNFYLEKLFIWVWVQLPHNHLWQLINCTAHTYVMSNNYGKVMVQARWNWYFVRKIFAGSGIWTQDLATDICFLARHLHISGNFLWISHNPWQYYRTLNFKIKKPSPNHLGSEHHRDGRIITSVSHFLLLLLLQWRQNKARGRMSPSCSSPSLHQALRVNHRHPCVYVNYPKTSINPELCPNVI